MEIGQGMTDWSHATMNRGHFSTPTQGAMQHTPSLAAQIPDPISGPVQVYSSSPSMAPLQVSLRYIPRSSEAPEYGACIYYPILGRRVLSSHVSIAFGISKLQHSYFYLQIYDRP